MPAETLSQYEEFLSLLLSSVTSGGSGFSSRDYVILLHHLREATKYLTGSRRYAKTLDTEEDNEERVLGARATLHDSVTTQIYSILMDLGRVSLEIFEENHERISIDNAY